MTTGKFVRYGQAAFVAVALASVPLNCGLRAWHTRGIKSEVETPLRYSPERAIPLTHPQAAPVPAPKPVRPPAILNPQPAAPIPVPKPVPVAPAVVPAPKSGTRDPKPAKPRPGTFNPLGATGAYADNQYAPSGRTAPATVSCDMFQDLLNENAGHILGPVVRNLSLPGNRYVVFRTLQVHSNGRVVVETRLASNPGGDSMAPEPYTQPAGLGVRIGVAIRAKLKLPNEECDCIALPVRTH